MKVEFSASGMVLAKDQLLSLSEAKGARIVSQGGTVWITQDGDPRDIVLGRGDSFVFDRATPTIVQAFEPALITLAEPAARPRPKARVDWARRLRAVMWRAAPAPARVV